MANDRPSSPKKHVFSSKTEEEWQAILPKETFLVTRKGLTEPPFSGQYWNHWEKGVYECACCHQVLFSSESKFEAYCGWPSFDQTSSENVISEHEDFSHQMHRIEVRCHVCQAHLGHVFEDGPTKTRRRYCINSSAIVFKPISDAQDKQK